VNEQVFSRETLAGFDGTDGRRAYVAFAGKVYDVTDSVLWKGGEHQGEHRAGNDLTVALDDAPHLPDELETFPVVGSIVD